MTRWERYEIMRAYIYHIKFGVKSIYGHYSILPSLMSGGQISSNRVNFDISGQKTQSRPYTTQQHETMRKTKTKFLRNIFYFYKMKVEKYLVFLVGKMGLEKSIPFVHSVDLV